MTLRYNLDNFYKEVVCCSGYESVPLGSPFKEEFVGNLVEWVCGKALASASLGPILVCWLGLLLLVALDSFWAQWGIKAWPFLAHSGPSGAVSHTPTMAAIFPHAGGFHQGESELVSSSIAPSPPSFTGVIHNKHLESWPMPSRRLEVTNCWPLVSSRIQSRQQNPYPSFQIEDTTQGSVSTVVERGKEHRMTR